MDRELIDLVAGVDPVPAEERLDTAELAAVRLLVIQRSITMQSTNVESALESAPHSPEVSREPAVAAPGRNRPGRGPLSRRILVATAGVAAVVALVVGYVALDDNSTSEINTSDEPTVGVAPDERLPPDLDPTLAAFASEGLEAADAFLAAMASGDVDEMLARSGEQRSGPADRNVYEFQAVYAAAGIGIEPGACTAVSATAELVLIECPIIVTDPVFVSLGETEGVAPFSYGSAGLVWRPWVIDFSAANRANGEYLRDRHPDEFAAACSPGAYEPGSVISDGGIALTGSCAELAAPLADDVARWISDGDSQTQG